MYCHIHHCHYHHCRCVPKDSKENGKALTQEELLAYTQEMKEELKDYTVDLKDQIFSYIDIGVNPVEIANTFASLKEQDTYILRTLTNKIDELNNTTNLSMFNLRTRVTNLEGQSASIIQDLSDRTERIVELETNTQVVESVAALSTINNPKDGLRVYVNSYHAGVGKGGGYFVYNSNKESVNDGGITLNGWVRQIDSSIIYSDWFGVAEHLPDNTSNTQKAIDYCASVGSILSASKGTYKFANTIHINNPVSVVFSHGAILKATEGFTDPEAIKIMSSDVHLDGLNLDATNLPFDTVNYVGATYGMGWGIMINEVGGSPFKNITIENGSILNSPFSAIFARSVEDIVVKNVLFKDCSQNTSMSAPAVLFLHGCNRPLVVDCFLDYPRMKGISLSTCVSGLISRCTATKPHVGHAAFYLANSEGCLIDSNVVEGFEDEASFSIKFSRNCKNNVISNNVFKNSRIMLQGNENIIVSNNTFTAMLDIAIIIDRHPNYGGVPVDGIYILNNNFDFAANITAISVNSADSIPVSNIIIKGNSFHNCSYALRPKGATLESNIYNELVFEGNYVKFTALGIEPTKFKDITIRGNTFEGTLDQPDDATSSYGVRIIGVASFKYETVIISDNNFKNIGRAQAVSLVSAAYYVDVSNNLFDGALESVLLNAEVDILKILFNHTKSITGPYALDLTLSNTDRAASVIVRGNTFDTEIPLAKRVRLNIPGPNVVIDSQKGDLSEDKEPLLLESPDGKSYTLAVDDTGVLTAVEV